MQKILSRISVARSSHASTQVMASTRGILAARETGVPLRGEHRNRKPQVLRSLAESQPRRESQQRRARTKHGCTGALIGQHRSTSAKYLQAGTIRRVARWLRRPRALRVIFMQRTRNETLAKSPTKLQKSRSRSTVRISSSFEGDAPSAGSPRRRVTKQACLGFG